MISNHRCVTHVAILLLAVLVLSAPLRAQTATNDWSRLNSVELRFKAVDKTQERKIHRRSTDQFLGVNNIDEAKKPSAGDQTRRRADDPSRCWQICFDGDIAWNGCRWCLRRVRCDRI